MKKHVLKAKPRRFTPVRLYIVTILCVESWVARTMVHKESVIDVFVSKEHTHRVKEWV